MKGRLGFQRFWEYFFCSEANASVKKSKEKPKGDEAFHAQSHIHFVQLKKGQKKLTDT
jgi:YHS domain-containing protein